MATQTITELQILEPTSLGITSRKSRDGPLAAILGQPSPEAGSQEPTIILPKARAAIVIAELYGVLFFNSFYNGAVVIALPAMQRELNLQEGLTVWPTSAYYLTAGSCLLLAGSIADVAGTKRANLIGSFLSAIFTMACGLARTEGQLIVFRALQGITNAIIAPSAVSIISNSVEEGRPRNMSFACIGFSQPLGFGFGLVLTGVLTDTVGWRPAFYLAAAATFAMFFVGIWALPRDTRPGAGQSILKRLGTQVDWVGVGLASMGLAMLSYVLASLSADMDDIHKASSIVLLIISGLSVPAFVGWMNRQIKHDRTALIPNSLWRNIVFTTSCVMVLLTTALTNCMELYSSLFFQQVQGVSALGASLRVLPSLTAGTIASVLTGIFVHRMSVFWVVLASSVMSTVAPLLMSFVRADQPYWENAFVAQMFAPMACDILSTVGLLIISDVFPKNTQALGGAVFNTCAQLGTAIGLSLTQVVAAAVTNSSSHDDKPSPEALLKGYRVAFWIMFGWMGFVCFVCITGLRKVGRIGVKRD